jgi:signal transduction histidine kinase
VTTKTAARLAWAFVALIVAGSATSLALSLANNRLGDVAFMAFISIFPIVGVVLATRRPANPLGWIMLGIGVVVSLPLIPYATYAHVIRHDELPGAAYAMAIDGPSWVWVLGPCGFLLLLFPDGHLPSPRWRWFAWAMAVGMVVLSLGFICFPGNGADSGFPDLENPLGIQALKPFEPFLISLIVTVPLTIVAGAVAVIRRLRHATDDVERHQLRWLAWASGIIAASYVSAFAFGWSEDSGLLAQVVQFASVASFALIPIAIGIAVLRYRLYDIDVVIRKTVIVGVLAVFIAVAYIAIVAGVGALVGSRANTAASALAAAVVAIAFQPVARRARRLADRVVYGRRATPYEVLADFSDRLGGAYDASDVLPRIAHVLGEGVGAERARVWLQVDGRQRVVATWPPEAGSEVEDDRFMEVRYRGEILGALSVALPADDPLDRTKESLLSDLAGQAGLVLRNVGLTEELRNRLDDLRAAQKRLVAAEDLERRRLERNIHDGAQQQLVALAVKARLARSLTERDPAKVNQMLEQIERETQTALEDLRDLARGIYPPLLADRGLAAALDSQARKSPLPVGIHGGEDLGRFPPEVEAAVYFSCLEALQNVSKYAEATRADVTLRRATDELTFEVRDDGRGFDPTSTKHGSGLQGISDRLGAADGHLEVRSAPGAGTVIVGRLPIPRSAAPAPALAHEEGVTV